MSECCLPEIASPTRGPIGVQQLSPVSLQPTACADSSSTALLTTPAVSPAVPEPHDAVSSPAPHPPALSASPPPEPLIIPPPTAPNTRGRALSATNARNASPRGVTPGPQAAKPKQSLDVERKPSVSYGHHRQTSIVHGVQHSRNPSMLASANTSPLGAHNIVATAGQENGGSYLNAGGLKKSPSMSTLHSNGHSPASAPMTKSFEQSSSGKRPERMHSSRNKRPPERHRSQSRAPGPGKPQVQPELVTVGEYALHHLFTSFIAEADGRIERCMFRQGEAEPRIEDVCGPNTDPAFDQLISSLGHINRHKPKSLIDSVIHWRKKKADAANMLFHDLQVARDAVTNRQYNNGSGITLPAAGETIAVLELNMAMSERRSLASVYILCRVLIEIIGQTTLKALNGSDTTLNTADRLEDVIYGQLQNAEPESLATSHLKRANWAIRGQLLGVMSGLRFEEVSDRFIQDLAKAQQQLRIKGMADQKLASKTALLVQSMRWLRIQVSPEDSWIHSCATLHLLAKFFAEVHGRTMKHAYAGLFEHLFLPIAARATMELNSAKWKSVINTIQPKVTTMLAKADHWPYVYPLQAVMLCVSPAETFMSQWLSIVTSFQPKARDRAGRSHSLKAICRLVWRYLYRMNDGVNAMQRKLDEIVKLVFQGGKRFLISTDPIIADPLIQLIRIIGFRHQDLCFRTIIFPLMNSELFANADRDLKIESLDPEKTVIAIRAFLAVMSDLEKGEAPPFPITFECDSLMDTQSRTPAVHRRTRSQGFAVSAGRTERLSRPVMTANFNDVAKDYYGRFCKILGHLTIICDNTFGGQAVLDEKYPTHNVKTPMAEAFTFNKRDDAMNPTDLRQHYYDLLHVAVEALPRCLSPHLPINSLVNLLCTGTAHVQSHIANSSAQSLKSIARQSHAQPVTVGFARFIFKFDDRYATVSDGGLLGPGHIENTLKLYVELLEIWIDDIQQRTRKAVLEPSDSEEPGSRQLPLDMSSILAQVDEIEAHGLFFLCSPSRAVRAVAINVLRLITKFETALVGKPSTRIISILDGSSQQVIDVNDERLSLAERSRLQRGLRRSNVNGTLVELCSSDGSPDASLWFKAFPTLVRLSSEICAHAVVLTREIVCKRLSHSFDTIKELAGDTRQTPYAAFEQAFTTGRPNARLTSSQPKIIIDQWKLHLIFACTTLTNIGGGQNQNHGHQPVSSQNSQHTRKSSKSSSTSQDKIASASELFPQVVRFLSAHNPSVRKAAALGLSATNATLFQTLLECLQPQVQKCKSEAQGRLNTHQRSMSSPRRGYETDNLRTEITHLLSLTCHLLHDPAVIADEYVLGYIVDYAKHLRIFLSDAEVQGQTEFQPLRTHYCTLSETLYEVTRKLKDSSRWMSFQSRQATFALMENWCGFSPNESHLRRQEDNMRSRVAEREQDSNQKIVDATQRIVDANQRIADAKFEKDRTELQTAALNAMAALCAGPLNFVADNKVLMQFDVRRIFSWVNAIFETPSDRTHAIGRKALQNLIVHNMDQPYLMAQTMRMCYIARLPKALTSYFEVVTQVLTDKTNVTTPFWKILCAGLYTLGNEDSQIRMKSARVLRTLEERQGKTSKLQDLDISVSDKTTAVYKLAQFEISRRLSRQHPELAFHVFSEFSAYFNELQPDHQRNMVSGMLPWIQTIELQLDPNGGPTPTSYMLLVNLFEITVKSSITLHNEIQALWQALATGPYGGNVQLVLEFIIAVCLDKKEQNFVIYAKQIVVFLSSTPAGAKVVEYLLLQICPRTMVAERKPPIHAPQDTAGLPYIADLATALPSGTKQSGLSLGQLSMILLVDLIVSPTQLPADTVPTLLQVILVQWDQYTSIVQDQAREMLVHMIHELVISKIEPGSTKPDKKSIEDFIESVRRHDQKITWSYADSEIRPGEENGLAVSEPMAYVVEEVVRIFSVTYPGIREEWGKVTLAWATSCAVRHVACRSFQIFRCISTTLDQQMLADMLARLSNTIADDENHDYLVFSLEILTTLRSIIDALEPMALLQYGQLFWTTCACLDTIFENEFQEGLSMLQLLLSKMDLSDPAALDMLRRKQPPTWEGGFYGVHALIYKGVRSSRSTYRSLQVMERLIKFPSNDIVGADDRLLFTILANLPRYLRHFNDPLEDAGCFESADTLAFAAEGQALFDIAKALRGFATMRYRNERDFLAHTIAACRAAFFPSLEFSSLVFLLGMVNNQTDWFKVKSMQVLSVILSDTDMRKPEIASQGPDLISPLLRLLQTEHCQQALGVLDNVIDMTGTPLDNKHLRMSMAGSHTSRATRKEYDNTKSLYGIPEESGWSIPMPAIHSARTRSNVHAVFYTLAEHGNGDPQPSTTTPEIPFEHDEYQTDTYFGEHAATIQSDDMRLDGNMGDLAMKLDSLDDFFDEESDTTSPLEQDGAPRYPSLVEEREHLYDQQALPILHRSLKRNASVTSFQTGFAEMRYPTSQQQPAIMNPGAFAHNAAASGLPPSRPGLHNRSVTSPVMASKPPRPRIPKNDNNSGSAVVSGDEGETETEPFSDDDMNISRAHTVDDNQGPQGPFKPVGFKAFRQGLRRLTNSGSRGEGGSRSAGNGPARPGVPKVPAMYRQDPVSAEP
ncbi:hypothetical protein MBLNU230_g1723t1 [Neophaeotheca triangularis]